MASDFRRQVREVLDIFLLTDQASFRWDIGNGGAIGSRSSKHVDVLRKGLRVMLWFASFSFFLFGICLSGFDVSAGCVYIVPSYCQRYTSLGVYISSSINQYIWDQDPYTSYSEPTITSFNEVDHTYLIIRKIYSRYIHTTIPHVLDNGNGTRTGCLDTAQKGPSSYSAQMLLKRCLHLWT